MKRASANTHRRIGGTHTVRRLSTNARTVASATWSGVLDQGAGLMPLVILPITNPGRTINNLPPVPVSASALAWAGLAGWFRATGGGVVPYGCDHTAVPQSPLSRR